MEPIKISRAKKNGVDEACDKLMDGADMLDTALDGTIFKDEIYALVDKIKNSFTA